MLILKTGELQSESYFSKVTEEQNTSKQSKCSVILSIKYNYNIMDYILSTEFLVDYLFTVNLSINIHYIVLCPSKWKPWLTAVMKHKNNRPICEVNPSGNFVTAAPLLIFTITN